MPRIVAGGKGWAATKEKPAVSGEKRGFSGFGGGGSQLRTSLWPQFLLTGENTGKFSPKWLQVNIAMPANPCATTIPSSLAQFDLKNNREFIRPYQGINIPGTGNICGVSGACKSPPFRVFFGPGDPKSCRSCGLAIACRFEFKCQAPR
jgi:hypothetical protein